MTPEVVIELARNALETALMMALPMLAVSLAVGIVVSVIQAATQIQEMTLTFVPKILSMFISLLIAFPWLMDKMISYTQELIMKIPQFTK